ncbi:hypothetical protein [Pseudomonas sp. A34-9]|uniref:hypothetical protein n=1 Tax=Pseudomonas sp. A34-9 TaxID=3034675 RepID=UPI00240D470A|nr:hypothetical protein [Pseudomonas sp. A34-9]
MDIQSTELESAFQLYPMLIPGWRPSVRPAGIAHGGIPQSIYQAPDGLFTVIDPLTTLSAPMAAYDTVELWINGKGTSVIKIIQPGEENKRIALFLPPGLLNDGINKAFYRVDRLGGNFECSEPVLDLLYHNPAPGYPAPGGMTVSHPANVGPTEAAAGVEITAAVSFTRLYDEVTLTVGTWSRSITVTDVTKPLAWTLTAADFQQIGDNPQMPVSARVVDQLGNSNLSATTFMDIHASQRLLEQAILKENLDENNDDPNYVDLTKMNGGPLWAVVHLIREYWSVKDRIRLKFTAELGGKEVASHEETLEITQVPAQFSWRIENAMVIADSRVTVIYEQLQGGEVIAVSRAAEASVSGKTPTIITENFDSLPRQEVTVGGAILTPVMTIRFLSGEGRLAVAPSGMSSHPDIPGIRERNVLHLGFETSGRQTVELELLRSCEKVSFWYFWINEAVALDFYDSKGTLLDRKLLVVEPIIEPKYFEFAGIDIRKIVLTAPVVDWVGFDFFSFTS